MTNACNVPLHAPLFPDPFVPYECKNNKSVFAAVEVDKEEIERVLSYTPFEYVDNKVVFSITDFSNCDKVAYMDCAIVVPVKYGNKYGGYYIYEYENKDSAIAAGRDLWGYPKKYADISLIEKQDKLYGTAKKDGQTIIKVTADLNSEIPDYQEPVTTPHLNVRTIPKPTGGVFMQEIIERDTSPDFVLHDKTYCDVEVKLNSSETDPLNLLAPKRAIGGGVVRGDFYATEENGWGSVLKTLNKN